MFQCSYCNYESIYKYNVQRHEHVHNKNSTQNNIAPTTISVDSNVNNLLNQTQSGFITQESIQHTYPNEDYNVNNIQNQHNSQYGTGSTVIPIEDYREVVGIAHKWKKECEKMQEAYQLLQEHRREDGENSHAIITYLQNVLNANNIRYNLELA